MTAVVVTHAVGNIDTWLKGADERRAFFTSFSSSYRIFRHAKTDRVSIVWEDVDIDRMEALLSSPEGKAAKAAHTVVDPLEVFIEVEGGG